jgi:Protein of unknown function (DUF2000)
MITLDDSPKTLEKKLVAVLNEKLEPGVALNALAHMALGMGTVLGPIEAMMCDYVDADHTHHPSISAYPFIVLKGRPTKIREAIDAAKNGNVKVVDFTNTMTVGTYVEQLQRTKSTPNSELEFYGAVFYGDISAVSEITRKFSLYK